MTSNKNLQIFLSFILTATTWTPTFLPLWRREANADHGGIASSTRPTSKQIGRTSLEESPKENQKQNLRTRKSKKKEGIHGIVREKVSWIQFARDLYENYKHKEIKLHSTNELLVFYWAITHFTGKTPRIHFKTGWFLYPL